MTETVVPEDELDPATAKALTDFLQAPAPETAALEDRVANLERFIREQGIVGIQLGESEQAPEKPPPGHWIIYGDGGDLFAIAPSGTSYSITSSGTGGHGEGHNHDGTPTEKLLAANSHESPSVSTHHVKYTDAEVDTIVETHRAIAGDHHAKYTDAEVDTILAVHTAVAAAHHTKYTDAEVDTIVATHAAIAASHHARPVTATTAAEGLVEIANAGEVTAGAADRVMSLPLHSTLVQGGFWLYGTDAGGDDAYVVLFTPSITGYTTGMMISFEPSFTNVGAASLEIESLGAKTIKKHHDQDLSNGDIEAGQIVVVQYDGTNFQMQSQLANAPAGGHDEDHDHDGAPTQKLLAANTHESPATGTHPVPAVRAYNSSAISIANSSVVALTFNNERFDTDTMHSTSTNTDRLTAKTAGKYQISFTGAFASNATGRRHLIIEHNGGTVIAIQEWDTNQNERTYMVSSTLYHLAVNDYVKVKVFQNSGGALNMDSNNAYSPEFMMVWVAP